MKIQCFVLLPLVIFLTFSPNCHSFSWSWFSSSKPSSSNSEQFVNDKGINDLVAEYSFEAWDDPEAIMLLETARTKLKGSNPCWSHAYMDLFSTCSEIYAEEGKMIQLAWLLTDCFQRDSGKTSLPSCNTKGNMKDCLRKLNNDDEHTTYWDFFREASDICYQLQSKACKIQVEGLINDLKDSALSTKEKLESIDEKSDSLLHSSYQLQESVMTVDEQMQKVGENLINLSSDFDIVMEHSNELREQAREIASSQVELLEGRGVTREKMEENMAIVEESYSHLTHEIEVLQIKAGEVEKEVTKLGVALSLKLQNLQGKADDIADIVGISIKKQEQLLESQSEALVGVESEALEDNRNSLQQIVGFAQGQHLQLKKQQEQLSQLHNLLANNSKSMLEAQEALESKQANLFTAIDKLYALYNTMLLESRLIKAFLVYSLLLVLLHMSTSIKQMYSVRCNLYIGLCIAFAIDCGILQFTSIEIEQKTQLGTLVKYLLGAFTVSHLLYSFISYRDFESLKYRMLATLIEKVNNVPKERDYKSEAEDADGEAEDADGEAEAELPEDKNITEAPVYSPQIDEQEWTYVPHI